MIVCDLCKEPKGISATRVTLVSERYPLAGEKTGMGPPEDLACFDMCEECQDVAWKGMMKELEARTRAVDTTQHAGLTGPSPINKHGTVCRWCGAAPLAHHLSECDRPEDGRNPHEPEGTRPAPTPPPPPANESTTGGPAPVTCSHCGGIRGNHHPSCEG